MSRRRVGGRCLFGEVEGRVWERAVEAGSGGWEEWPFPCGGVRASRCPPDHSLTCLTPAGAKHRLDVKGLFYGIGHTPNSGLVAGQIELDEAGYVKVGAGRPLGGEEREKAIHHRCICNCYSAPHGMRKHAQACRQTLCQTLCTLPLHKAEQAGRVFCGWPAVPLANAPAPCPHRIPPVMHARTPCA